MKIELCKKKTKCKLCKDIMNKGEVRAVTGSGTYYDPIRYLCIKCFKKEGFPFDNLIKVYKQKIKFYEQKIKGILDMRKQL